MKKRPKEIAIISGLAMIAVIVAASTREKEQAVPKEMVKGVCVVDEVKEVCCLEIKKEIVAATVVSEASQPEVKYYDVPLSEELQTYIFDECEKHNISPAIIIAMIEKESRFTTDAVGDSGNSLGLMQIQPKWHKARMDKLGCNDLLNPYQNITVGIDIVAELKEANSDIYWVLMAYNSGIGNANKRIVSGNYSDYALEVVERATELERMCD